MTPAGIEPATFRFVAQHLNHCATAVPLSTRVLIEYNKRRVEATEMDALRRSSRTVMGKLFKEGAKGKKKNFRRANIIY